MKYYEVFKDGMPMWLYQLSEEERLKFDFDVDSNHIVTLRKQKGGLYDRILKTIHRK